MACRVSDIILCRERLVLFTLQSNDFELVYFGRWGGGGGGEGEREGEKGGTVRVYVLYACGHKNMNNPKTGFHTNLRIQFHEFSATLT